MINKVITYCLSHSVHTPRLAVVRFLLAFGVLLTLSFNSLDIIANQNYQLLPEYAAHHTQHTNAPLKKYNLFILLQPEVAKVCAIIVLLWVMSGWIPQVSCLLHFWVMFSFYNYVAILNGGDKLAYILCALLVPICLLDHRWNQWKTTIKMPSSHANIIANITLWFIYLQSAWVYFDASISKLFTPQWLDGSAVYYYTTHYKLGAPAWLLPINEAIFLSPLGTLISWLVLLLELLLGFAFVLPFKTRKYLLLPALFFHGLIAINMGLISFFFAIAAMLLLYLIDDIPMLFSALQPYKKRPSVKTASGNL